MLRCVTRPVVCFDVFCTLLLVIISCHLFRWHVRHEAKWQLNCLDFEPELYVVLCFNDWLCFLVSEGDGLLSWLLCCNVCGNVLKINSLVIPGYSLITLAWWPVDQVRLLHESSQVRLLSPPRKCGSCFITLRAWTVLTVRRKFCWFSFNFVLLFRSVFVRHEKKKGCRHVFFSCGGCVVVI